MNAEEKKLFEERFNFLSSCDTSLRQAIVCLSHFANFSATPAERERVKAALCVLGYPMKQTNYK